MAPKMYVGLTEKEQTMDIHHAMMVHNKPDRLYEALTQQSDLEVWMGAPTLAGARSWFHDRISI
jgi:uncharacterized protein YndB with AHSA1/START domain